MAGYADEGVNGDPLQRMPDPEGFQRTPNPLALLSGDIFSTPCLPQGRTPRSSTGVQSSLDFTHTCRIRGLAHLSRKLNGTCRYPECQ